MTASFALLVAAAIVLLFNNIRLLRLARKQSTVIRELTDRHLKLVAAQKQRIRVLEDAIHIYERHPSA